MRIAYLILAHRNPAQVARLIDRLPADSPILMHWDERADEAWRQSRLVTRSNVLFVKQHASPWGSFGLVDATMELIRGLRGVEYDYATLLSGQDYPIKSNGEIAEYLRIHQGAEFIEAFPIDEPNRWSNATNLYKTPERILARHVQCGNKLIRLPGLRRLPHGMRPFGGHQWWTLSREAINYIDSFVDVGRGVFDFLRESFIPDQLVFHTILGNSEQFAPRITEDNLRMSIWGRPTPPYPAILTSADLPTLLASPAHFARKFDQGVDPGVLDRLDEA